MILKALYCFTENEMESLIDGLILLRKEWEDSQVVGFMEEVKEINNLLRDFGGMEMEE